MLDIIIFTVHVVLLVGILCQIVLSIFMLIELSDIRKAVNFLTQFRRAGGPGAD